LVFLATGRDGWTPAGSVFEDFSTANYTSVASNAQDIVAEVLVYDRALSVTERGAVETRYGSP
jgi:hypothetical protein